MANQVAPQKHILGIRAISNGTGASTKNLTSCPAGSAIDYAVAYPETGFGEVNAAAALTAAEKTTPRPRSPTPGSTYFAEASGSASSAGPTDTGGYVHAGILSVLAVIALGGAFLLVRRRRRTAAA